MRPIGFSTGALAKGDFARGLSIQRSEAGTAAVELSALRENELEPLLAGLPELDLTGFEYISVHAPSKLRGMPEETAFELLAALPASWPIVVHPEIMLTPKLWASLGSRLCIENMDDRKTTGRTVAELRQLFFLYPQAGFCLDVGHARQIDPTMASAILMLQEFGSRLRQIHVSEVGPMGEHLPLGVLARIAFKRVVNYVPAGCPLIIESVIRADEVKRERAVVMETFEAGGVESTERVAVA